jgi:glucan phosphoethanolaminetransferase (alkaline phosphatase superfamily)
MSFEQQDFNPDIKPNTENTSTPNWRELLLIGVLAFWLLESVVHWIMTLLSIDSWYGPGEAISTLLGVLFAFIPILIAVCIRQRNLRIIAVIIGSILTISILSKYFYWSFQVF